MAEHNIRHRHPLNRIPSLQQSLQPTRIPISSVRSVHQHLTSNSTLGIVSLGYPISAEIHAVVWPLVQAYHGMYCSFSSVPILNLYSYSLQRTVLHSTPIKHLQSHNAPYLRPSSPPSPSASRYLRIKVCIPILSSPTSLSILTCSSSPPPPPSSIKHPHHSQ